MDIDYDDIVTKHFSCEKTLECLEKDKSTNTIDNNVDSIFYNTCDNIGDNINNNTVLGIDLGTTNTCVSIWRNNNLEIIPDEYGNKTIPSYVGFTNVNRYIGHDAKNQKELNSGNVLYEVKRLIGRKYDDQSVNLDSEYLIYNILPDKNNGILLETAIGKKYTPEEISSMVLVKAKQMASKYLGESINKAVITVPAYFNDSQRQATKDAATIAGLNCIRIINEPTAAALAYGLIDKSLKNKSNNGGLNVLVYDLGGGTLDVSILNITDGIFEVLSSVGNTHLGGADFDNRIIGHCLNYFKKKNNIETMGDLSSLSLQKLKRSCENAKITLSSSKKSTILVSNFYNNIDLAISISQDEYVNICRDLLILCMKPIEDALCSAEISKTNIDEIILVGGMTRMPAIKDNIKMLFNGKNLNMSLNPDEVVSAGAAIQGYILTNSDDPFSENVTLLDIVSLSLGIETYGGIMNVIIPRNSVVPIVKKRQYTTDSDYCESVLIKVYEGERKMTKDNFLVGQFELGGIESLPRGIPRIEVKFSIDVNGIITVTARDKDNDNVKNITISGNKGRLSKDQIDELIKNAREYEIKDGIEKHKKILYYNIEELCFNIIANTKNGHYKLSSDDVNLIVDDINDVMNWLKDKLYCDRDIDDFIKVNDTLNRKYGTLILKNNVDIEQKNVKSIVSDNNNSTNIYDDDDESNILYEKPSNEIENEYIGIENVVDSDKSEIRILRKQLIDICTDVYDMINSNNMGIADEHVQELKYFIDDILLHIHIHQNPTIQDYIDKINTVNDSCNKIFELYNQNMFNTDNVSKKQELEQLCFTIKSSISNNIFSNDESSLSNLDMKIDDILDWLINNNDSDDEMCSVKIDEINNMCTKLYHTMLGINIHN